MDSQQESSYHEDILKVKKIWNDLKRVKNAEKLQRKSKFNEEKNKKDQIRPYQKIESKLQKAKSQNNLKSIPQGSPQQVINFSTVLPNNDNQIKAIKNSSAFIESFEQKKIIYKKDQELALLRITNQQLKEKLKSLENELKQKNELIQKFKAKQEQLLGETIMFKNQKVADRQNSLEYLSYKNDSIRLLKMLQTTKQFKQFASLAIQDNSVRFLHQANKNKKSIIDAIDDKKLNVHFCSCNGSFIQQQNLWVPQNAFDYAKNFTKQKRGQRLTQAQVQLLLFELNRIWRQREKRILNSANSLKALQVGKYKRRIEEIQKTSAKKLQTAE